MSHRLLARELQADEPIHQYRAGVSESESRNCSRGTRGGVTAIHCAGSELSTDATIRTESAWAGNCSSWTSGPVPNVAVVPLAGGQWQPATRHEYGLAVVTPGRVAGLRLTADLVSA
ncbi:hypothetical protein [Nocardia flavorosea]|uniref:hypothetical protein n=1 Tax=Nocardia flavorosea TaxID=53429 RepID=UPI001FF9CF85|nr:hypothetical protein [Nocardia flavorosea]